MLQPPARASYAIQLDKLHYTHFCIEAVHHLTDRGLLPCSLPNLLILSADLQSLCVALLPFHRKYVKDSELHSRETWNEAPDTQHAVLPHKGREEWLPL